MISKLGDMGILVAIGSIIVAFLYKFIKNKGVKEEQQKNQIQTLKEVEVIDEIKQNNLSATDEQLVNELRKYARDKQS